MLTPSSWRHCFLFKKLYSFTLAGVAQWTELACELKGRQWVVGQVPSRGRARGNHTLMFLSLFSSPVSKNKIFKKIFLNKSFIVLYVRFTIYWVFVSLCEVVVKTHLTFHYYFQQNLVKRLSFLSLHWVYQLYIRWLSGSVSGLVIVLVCLCKYHTILTPVAALSQLLKSSGLRLSGLFFLLKIALPIPGPVHFM